MRYTTLLIATFISTLFAYSAWGQEKDYQRAKFDPIHFPPLIEKATDAQCLACHSEVLAPSLRTTSPAGLPAEQVKAWYQFLSTYEGKQETFHRRHLSTPFATSIMQMRCNTCHVGNEPRDEMQGTPPINSIGLTLRKMVDPNFCLQCHGQMPIQLMGLPSPWPESKRMFADSCLTCHSAIRTTRHQVNYLKPAEIEKLAAENGSDVCYGCHGGRAWYRNSFPYPRHAWPGMGPDLPDWAKGRATESPQRFRLTTKTKK